ncbi:hypothetical protein OBBRIDRAFT_805631 [Obba rivulosa]|uniref:Uncharacterized protein n=1 Tax=Obba rivulosa TaxID=1052685 RepID=A0A8E2AP29_9APHY|nr:hypothetical protein OBBRIDRAFT_805631 [Obba rivulosa]
MAFQPIDWHLDSPLGALQISVYPHFHLQSVWYHCHTDNSYAFTLYKVAVGHLSVFLAVSHTLIERCIDHNTMVKTVSYNRNGPMALNTFHQVLICHAGYTFTVTDYSNILDLTLQTWLAWTVVSDFGKSPATLTLVAHSKREKMEPHHYHYVIVIRGVRYSVQVAFGVKELSFYGNCSPKDLCPALVNNLVYSTALNNECKWASMLNNDAYIVFYTALPSLLFNALLATLNARHELHEVGYGNPVMISMLIVSGGHTSSLTDTDAKWYNCVQNTAIGSFQIKVDRTHHIV